MSESQLELEKNRVKQRNRLTQVLPDVMQGVGSMTAEVYKDGVLKLQNEAADGLGRGARDRMPKLHSVPNHGSLR